MSEDLVQRWESRYREDDTPWDSGLPSRELQRVLDERGIPPGRAIELGCGTGTNAVFLAERGFDVTAIDLAAPAIDHAREKAKEAGVAVNFTTADVTRFDDPGGPFDFVFDRGCYHCVRRTDVYGFLVALRRLTRPGSTYLCLTGNANEAREHGPPSLSVEQIGRELGPLFRILHLREMRFEDPGGVEGPLGWSVLMHRRNP